MPKVSLTSSSGRFGKTNEAYSKTNTLLGCLVFNKRQLGFNRLLVPPFVWFGIEAALVPPTGHNGELIFPWNYFSKIYALLSHLTLVFKGSSNSIKHVTCIIHNSEKIIILIYGRNLQFIVQFLKTFFFFFILCVFHIICLDPIHLPDPSYPPSALAIPSSPHPRAKIK